MADLYHYEDVQEILSRAIAHQAHTDDLTRAQLLEIAAELDISPENLRLAEQEWLSEKGELQERQVFDLQRRQDFQNHLAKYGIVNTFLLFIVVSTPLSLPWVVAPALVWGVGLSLQGWNAYYPRGRKYELQFQTWRRRRQIGRSVNRLLNRWLGA